LTKMQVPQGESLRRMLFSPDGTCLLLLGGEGTASGYRGYARLLHLMPAADTEPCDRTATGVIVAAPQDHLMMTASIVKRS
ncbi:MAG: hypothetical protein OXC07_09630, partial [Kistimonas sp.]|nr:hypothetical protein [Kistimonas sp.]